MGWADESQVEQWWVGSDGDQDLSGLTVSWRGLSAERQLVRRRGLSAHPISHWTKRHSRVNRGWMMSDCFWADSTSEENVGRNQLGDGLWLS